MAAQEPPQQGSAARNHFSGDKPNRNVTGILTSFLEAASAALLNYFSMTDFLGKAFSGETIVQRGHSLSAAVPSCEKLQGTLLHGTAQRHSGHVAISHWNGSVLVPHHSQVRPAQVPEPEKLLVQR